MTYTTVRNSMGDEGGGGSWRRLLVLVASTGCQLVVNVWQLSFFSLLQAFLHHKDIAHAPDTSQLSLLSSVVFFTSSELGYVLFYGLFCATNCLSCCVVQQTASCVVQNVLCHVVQHAVLRNTFLYLYFSCSSSS